MSARALLRSRAGVVAVAAGVLAAGAVGTQAVANATVPFPDVGQACDNLSVSYGPIQQDIGTGAATITRVDVAGVGTGCVGRTISVDLLSHGRSLGAGRAEVRAAGQPVTITLAEPADIRSLDSVAVVAR